MVAMKNIKAFCEAHNIDFSNLEKEWFDIGKEAK